MNILFLLLISTASFACVENLTLEKIFTANGGLPSYSHFKVYISALLKKGPLREKYCGEKLDSPACLKKLRKLDNATLIKLQNGLHHSDLLIHENSGQADIDEFLVKEFSNSEGRSVIEDFDPHRMPLIKLQSDRKDIFLNMLAVQCQQHLTYKKDGLFLGKLLVNSSEDLSSFMKANPLPVAEYSVAFESTAIAFGSADRGAGFFSACLENLEKSCELQPEQDLCELKRTVRAAAWKYSEVTHQLNYFESIRGDGHRLYPSTGEILVNRLVLQTPKTVLDFGACQK